MEEVSEEEEGCERGVLHSMCPWLFSAPELLRAEQVDRGGVLKGEGFCRTAALAVPVSQGQVSRSCSLVFLSFAIHHLPLLLLFLRCLPAYLAGSLVGFNNGV